MEIPTSDIESESRGQVKPETRLMGGMDGMAYGIGAGAGSHGRAGSDYDYEHEHGHEKDNTGKMPALLNSG